MPVLRLGVLICCDRENIHRDSPAIYTAPRRTDRIALRMHARFYVGEKMTPPPDWLKIEDISVVSQYILIEMHQNIE